MKKLVIAIDGPAASGKSTTARWTARRLGYIFVDTGAMYRAMTLKVLEKELDPHDEQKIGDLAGETEIELEQTDDHLIVLLDKKDVTHAIRSPAVTKAVSGVSAMKRVRDVMVREQRRMGGKGGIVLEGRDIGTVVFPDADLKVYMVANVDERARRRQKEMRKEGFDLPLEELKQDIRNRDLLDSSRNHSPLRQADDAIVLDTSNLTIDEQVDVIVSKARKILEMRE